MTQQTNSKKWMFVSKLENFQPGIPIILQLDGLRIAVYKIDGEEGGLFAIEDVCTHDDGPVAQGNVEGCTVECPRHGAKFDIKSGNALSMPAITPIRTFPTRVINSQVEVEVESK